MDQYKKLWEGEQGRTAVYSECIQQPLRNGRTDEREKQWVGDMLARIGAGVNPEQMHAGRIDGYNPLAVIDAIRRKKKILLEDKDGPVLLDTVTYRYSGHSPSDASSYRTKEEVDSWMAHDPLITFRKQLTDASVASDETFDGILDYARNLITRILKISIDDSVSPRMDLIKDPQAISRLMFSNQRIEKMDDRECEVLMPKEETLSGESSEEGTLRPCKDWQACFKE